MPLTLNPRPPKQSVRFTTDLDQATADHVGTVIARMQCTRTARAQVVTEQRADRENLEESSGMKPELTLR